MVSYPLTQRPRLTHATRLIDLERALDLFDETALQQLVGSAVGFLSVYYMVGFARCS
jgi:hypothetical protein